MNVSSINRFCSLRLCKNTISPWMHEGATSDKYKSIRMNNGKGWVEIGARDVGAGLVLPCCNTQAMQWHLDEISSQVAPNAHAVLILDCAGWHTTNNLDVPANITLLPLPPRAPKLSPVENIWQCMRDNWLSNRVFKSYDEIVALCCEAWNKRIDQPWKIMSIGMRKWAHGV